MLTKKARRKKVIRILKRLEITPTMLEADVFNRFINGEDVLHSDVSGIGWNEPTYYPSSAMLLIATVTNFDGHNVDSFERRCANVISFHA